MAIPVTTTAALGSAGTAAAPGAVAASETIDAKHVGHILEVTNGSGAPINVTFTDPGHTPAGNTGTQAAESVAAGATRRWRLSGAFVGGPSNARAITVGFSATASVTAEILA